MDKFLKFVMFTFNFIFWVIGGTMLGIGIWLAVDPNAYKYLHIASSAGMNDSVWAAAVYSCIAIGAFVFLVGFLGCWGSLGNGRRSALAAYSVLVILIIGAEIVVVILSIVFQSSITETLMSSMQNDVKTKYNTTNEVKLTEVWDIMQSKGECCGSYNYTDYVNSYYTNTTSNVVPMSCCDIFNDEWDENKIESDYRKCKEEAIQPHSSKKFDYLYSKGCYDGLNGLLNQHAAILIGITCGFAGLQIIGVIIACCLLSHSNRSKQYN